MFRQRSLAAALSGSVFSDEMGKSTRMRFPPTASLSCFHAACDGQFESEGRRRRKFVSAHNRRGKTGSKAADPIAFRNALLFTIRFRGLGYRLPQWRSNFNSTAMLLAISRNIFL